ncbi:Retinoblastoma-binding protein [Coemansia sp. RSA 487]|nr:Retinoblastoma-binding protein [Coemansia sp. RSA 487]
MVYILALGSNSGGQIAMGDTEDRHHTTSCTFAVDDTPEESSDGTWSVCGGGNHAFLWSCDGRQLFGCGSNSDGELALGADVSMERVLRWTRVELPDECRTVRKVACGWSHTLALTNDGRVYVAGSGSFGQLGIEELLSASRKKHIDFWMQPAGAESIEFSDIACGLRHSLLLAANGSVYGCGANRKGQLGDASLGAKVSSLVCVSRGLPPIAMVACGRAHSILVAADRVTVFVAGDDRYAQCGPSNGSQQHSWRSFRLPRRARKLCAGWEFGAVLMDPSPPDEDQHIRGGGTVAMWGRADHGQLGNIDASAPVTYIRDLVAVELLDGVVDLACGSNHAVAVTCAGEVHAWGWNEHGNVGNPSLCDVGRPRRIVLIGAETTQASSVGFNSQQNKFPGQGDLKEMSQIQYKFRSSKDYSTTFFDGLSISVDDLKQEILREQKLDPDEFDLVITNEQTNEDYKSDSILIPKNTMVLVRRIPFTGTRMPRASANVQQQQQQQLHQQGYGHRGGGGGFYRNHNTHGPPAPPTQYGYRGPQGVGLNVNKPSDNDPDQDAMDDGAGIADDAEDARIAAMLQQSTEQWSHQQSMMEMQRRTGAYRPRPHMIRPERQGPPPPNYVCHRCGTQGHWIDKCPTFNQPNDGTGRPPGHRIKRTTGIPRSFLQKVDNLDDVGNALVTSDGTLVVATANKAAWDNAQRLTGSTISTDDAVDASQVPDALKCYICRNLARDAVTTPCCKTVFCSACIESALLQSGDMRFTCPDCNTKGVVPDQLETAGEVRGKVDEFLREYAAKRRRDAQEADAKSADAATANKGTATGDVPPPSGTQPKANGNAVSRPPVQMPPRPRVPHQNMGMMPPHGMMMGMGPGFPGMPMGMPIGMPPYMPPGMMPPYPQLPGMVPGVGAPWGAGMPTPQQQQPAQNNDRSPTISRSPSRSRSPVGSPDDDNDIALLPADEKHISDGPGIPRASDSNDDHRSSLMDRSQGSGRSRSRYGDHRSSRRRRDSNRSQSRSQSQSRGGSDRNSSKNNGSGRQRSRRRDDNRRWRLDSERHRSRGDDRYSSRGRDESRHRNEERSRRRENNRDSRSENRNRSQSSAARRSRARVNGPGRSRSPARADSKAAQVTIRGKSSGAGSADTKAQQSILDRIRDERPEKQGGTRDGKGEDERQKQKHQPSSGSRRRRGRRN